MISSLRPIAWNHHDDNNDNIDYDDHVTMTTMIRMGRRRMLDEMIVLMLLLMFMEMFTLPASCSSETQVHEHANMLEKQQPLVIISALQIYL